MHPLQYDAVEKASSYVIAMHENLSCVTCHCGIVVKCHPFSSQQGYSSSPAVNQGDPWQAFGLALDASCLLGSLGAIATQPQGGLRVMPGSCWYLQWVHSSGESSPTLAMPSNAAQRRVQVLVQAL